MRNGRQKRSSGIVQEVVDSFLRTTGNRLTHSLFSSIGESIDSFIRKELRTALLYCVSAVLIALGCVFLLLGGFHALQMLPISDAAAFAIMGLVGLAAGIATVLISRAPDNT